MPRKFFKKHLPSAESVRNNRVLKLFGNTLTHPALWHLDRRSAATGVSIGMFCGLIPGPFQMLGAGIASIIFKGNLPVAILTTFYTNPFTIIPLYLLAYKIGSLVLQANPPVPVVPAPEWVWSTPVDSTRLLLEWMLHLGPTLALGVFLLACLLALISYFAVLLVWSSSVRRTRRERRKRERRTPS